MDANIKDNLKDINQRLLFVPNEYANGTRETRANLAILGNATLMVVCEKWKFALPLNLAE